MPTNLPIAVVSAAYSVDPREAVPLARRAGFGGVQFEARLGGLDLTGLTQSGRREFRHLLASNEQQIAGIRTTAGAKGFSPKADIDQAVAHLDKVMEAAAGLGAPVVCVDVGPLPEPARQARAKPKVDPMAAGLIILPTAADVAAVSEPADEVRPADAAFEASVDAALKMLGAGADRYGVMVAFRSELGSYAALERALAAASCPWFGIDLDPAAVLRDRWDLDEVFDRLGSQVRHVRARDARAGHDRRTQPAAVGRGDTDWGQVLGLLDEAGYRGWVSVDPLGLAVRAAGAREALGRLREVG